MLKIFIYTIDAIYLTSIYPIFLGEEEQKETIRRHK